MYVPLLHYLLERSVGCPACIILSDGRNIAPSVTRILYSKFVAGASDCHLLGYSLLAKIFVNFRDVLLAYFLLAKIRA